MGTLGNDCRGARDQVDLDVDAPFDVPVDRDRLRLERERAASDNAGEATRSVRS